MSEDVVRTVLVILGEHSRPVILPNDCASDKEGLLQATRKVYSDVVSPNDQLFFQIEDSSLGGRYVDLMDQKIANRSILSARVESSGVKDNSNEVIHERLVSINCQVYSFIKKYLPCRVMWSMHVPVLLNRCHLPL